jgi:hypothetical protein
MTGLLHSLANICLIPRVKKEEPWRRAWAHAPCMG